MSDLMVKLENLQHALQRLAVGIERMDAKDDLQRDGVIQRFEFTFELTWKTLKAYFENEGLQNLSSPKSVFREAYVAGMMDDEALWLDMLRDRNLTSHMYRQEMAVAVCGNVTERYLSAIQILVDRLESRIKPAY